MEITEAQRQRLEVALRNATRSSFDVAAERIEAQIEEKRAAERMAERLQRLDAISAARIEAEKERMVGFDKGAE